MKLICETIETVDTLIESENGVKNYYIEGIGLQSERPNANNRVYPKAIMDAAVAKFIKEKIETNTAVGELNHPETPRIDYERATHKIVELREDGNDYIVKALIMDTHMGKLVKALLDAKVTLGVSSRGLGSVTESEDGVEMVGDDFWLSTIDIVSDPSAPNAYVKGIKESCEYLMENGIIREIPKKILVESRPNNILQILKSALVEK